MMQDTVTPLSQSFQTALKDISQPTPAITKEIPVVIEEVEDEIIDQGETTPTPAETLAQAKAAAPVEMDDAIAETETDYLMFVVDFLQTILWEFLAYRKLESKAYEIAGANYKEKIRDLTAKLKANRIRKKEGTALLEYDTEERLLKELKETVDDFCSEIDLDDREKKMIQMPLKEIIKQRNKPLTPEMKLLISMLMVSAPRYAGLKQIK